MEWLHYGRYLHERLKGKPVQYITKRQEFYGRDFRVTPDVLIPRPETELLVETVLKERPDPGMVIDVGTGSGAIAVSLALESRARVIATDLSRTALGVAAGNAHRLAAGCLFLQADLMAPFADGVADVVVSNPPYVSTGDRDSLQPEVRDWEPHTALFAGTEGLDVYARLVPEAFRVLKSGGLLAMEIGFGQMDLLRPIVGGFHEVRFLSDLAGIPRVLVCCKP